jgi:hypothetical protein
MSAELLKKLRYKEGPALVLNTPEGFDIGFESSSALEGTYGFVLLFVNNSEEVREWVPKVVPVLTEDPVYWIIYPKQSSKVKSDLNRDKLFALVQEISDYRAVSNVAVDDKWSALRFRPTSKVK